MDATILIIEDNYVMQRIWQTELEREGFKVLLSNNSRIGFAKAKEDKPDLIILDSVLPDIDGPELCKMLKANPETGEIPIIFMSNFDASDDFNAAIEAGASDYMIKHKTMPETLIERIEQILKGEWEPITKRGAEVNIE